MPKDKFDIRARYLNRNRISASPSLSTVTKYVTTADGLQKPILGAIMSDPANEVKDPIVPVPRPKLIDALNPPAWVKVSLSILAVLCAALVGLPAAGIALPPAVVTIAGVISSLLVGLGIVSSGVSAAPPKE